MSATRTCLWFPPETAAAAVDCYLELVPGTRLLGHRRYDGDQPDMGADIWLLEIGGTPYQVMGAKYAGSFTTAASIVLEVADQAELDRVWDGFLARGGTEQQCSWIVDPFGLSWQILPTVFFEAFDGADAARAQRVVEAIWTMTRVDVAAVLALAGQGAAGQHATGQDAAAQHGTG
ncbi:MAG: VOC family protein [Austwickia sp.]|nr:VOC family protein [Actinomycetota bacterium]MCB1254108.1 VOC family protein [Austwickia sp.]